MNLDQKTAIFIGGTAHSGSTILDLMLSNSENSFSCGEINALFRPYRIHHFNPKCCCDDDSCNIWKIVNCNGELNLWRRLSRLFPHINYFVDSSKDLVWLKDQKKSIANSEFRAINIIIWKTPHEYALSKLKRNKLRGWKKIHQIS